MTLVCMCVFLTFYYFYLMYIIQELRSNVTQVRELGESFA